MRDDLQAEGFGWLFKSSLAGGGHIVATALQVTQLAEVYL